MLELRVVLEEGFDEVAEEFVENEVVVLKLEHSLVSLSKWESKFEKPFLGSEDKTDEEALWYIRAMSEEPIPDKVMAAISPEHANQINDYINASMTATWFTESKNAPKSREVITAEIVYNWMISLQIPFECENWHFNRLITLIRVVDKKNAPQKKRSKADIARQHRELNAQRRAAHGTSG